MQPAFYLVWIQNEVLLQGWDFINNAWVSKPLVFSVSFPGQFSDSKRVSLKSSSHENGGVETLNLVKLYLTGDSEDLDIVQGQWPYLGDTTPARPELNGGLEISFDNGRTYSRFSKQLGYESDSSTWLTLPAASIGLDGQDGVLGPFDTAHMLVRLNVPSGTNLFKVPSINLAADFDII